MRTCILISTTQLKPHPFRMARFKTQQTFSSHRSRRKTINLVHRRINNLNRLNTLVNLRIDCIHEGLY